jgi:hypothetical protein
MSSATILMWIALLIQHTIARTWLSVIDPTLYSALLNDQYEMKLRQEIDPFNSTNNIHIFPLSTKPPTPVKVPDRASDAPSSVVDQIANTITCSSHEVLYVVRMYDAWGDGWDKTRMVIKLSNGTIFDENIDQLSAQQIKNNSNTSENGGVRRMLKATSLYYFQQKPIEVPLVDLKSGNTISAIKMSSYLLHSSELSSETNQNSSTLDILQYENDRINAIPIFNDSLRDGTDGALPVCLSVDQCYEVTVNGGLWPEEVKWEILQSTNNEDTSSSSSDMDDSTVAIARGGAPSKCQFSIENRDTGTFVCPFRCDDDVMLSDVSNRRTVLPTEQMNSSSNVPLPLEESDAPTKAPVSAESSSTPTIIQIIVKVPTNVTTSSCNTSSSSSSSSLITLFRSQSRQNNMNCNEFQSDLPTLSPVGIGANNETNGNNTDTDFTSASTAESDEPTYYSSSTYSPSPSSSGTATKSSFEDSKNTSDENDFVIMSNGSSGNTRVRPVPTAPSPATPSASLPPTQMATSSLTPSSSYSIIPTVTWWPTGLSSYSPSPSATIQSAATPVKLINQTVASSVQVRSIDFYNLRGNGRE